MSTRSRRDPIDLTVIGGFLGAAKTTLLNELLRGAGERRLAVLVNDVGAINIDSELVEELKALPDGIVRAKGLLHLREDATHRYILQVVGRRFSIQADRPWDDAAAPASQLVVIGLPGAVDARRLETALERLTAPASA